MSIEERLDALTHSLELWSQMQMDAYREHERDRQKHEKEHEQERQQREQDREEREKDRQEYEKRFRANETRLAQLMDTMNRLGRILEIHDQQIDDHGHRLDNLEN
ncbi:MAG: hypothetical protein ACLP59_11835 [Bryobacteraceae bacterium]